MGLGGEWLCSIAAAVRSHVVERVRSAAMSLSASSASSSPLRLLKAV